jgi:hypothetical protein
MDIQTPDGSILGADNGTQYTYPWDEKQRQLIDDHKAYHYEMMFFVEDLEKNGPTGNYEQPKKPKGDLQALLGDRRKRPNLLSGQDLHKYLVQNTAKKDPSVSCPRVFEVGLFPNLESILKNLQAGYKMLKHANSISLSASLDYGDWLIVAFALYNNEKQDGKVLGTWKEWLEENVGIQDSYARKLREIAKLLDKYPRFRTLGLSFSEVYSRRKQIENMLKLDRSVAQYWQQVG